MINLNIHKLIITECYFTNKWHALIGIQNLRVLFFFGVIPICIVQMDKKRKIITKMNNW